MSVKPGCVAICSDTRRRDWGARGSLSLKPITAFSGCIRSTVSWMDLCVKESLLYKPREDLSTLSRNDYHFKYGNVWVHSGSRVSAERLIQNQFTVFLFSLKVPHCRTATQSIFLRLGCLFLLIHVCPLTASLHLYYMPCHSLFTPR